MDLVYTYDAVSYKFTGKERDSESGLDNFGKRCNPFAICLVNYQSFLCTLMPSVTLHVIEFAF